MSPCPTSLPIDPAPAAVAGNPLQALTGAPGSAVAPNAAGSDGAPASPAAFQDVLAHVDKPASATTDADAPSSKRSSTDAGATVAGDQLALMFAMILPIAPTPAPPAPAANGAEAAPVAALAGPTGNQIPQLLATGVSVLHYELQSPPAAPGAANASQSAAGQNGAAMPNADDSPAATLPLVDADVAAAPGAATAKSTNQSSASTPAAGANQSFGATIDAKSDGVANSGSQPTPDSATQPTPAATDSSATGATAKFVRNIAASNHAFDRAASGSNGAKQAATASNSTAKNLPVSSNANAAAVSATGAEKIAEPAGGKRSFGDNSSPSNGKNRSLDTDDKRVTDVAVQVGTGAANGGKPITHDMRTFAVTPAADPAASSAATNTAQASAPSVSHAADLVHQIREIADGMWAVDRNSVEVKFKFSDSDRLSVRVEYRDGAVQATFRTDSPDLRDAIAHEWQSGAAASDSRPYRVEDPVFVNSTSGSGLDFASGDQSRQQQRSPEQAPRFDPLFPFASSSRGTSASSSSSTSAPTVRTVETAGHLHALV